MLIYKIVSCLIDGINYLEMMQYKHEACNVWIVMETFEINSSVHLKMWNLMTINV